MALPHEACQLKFAELRMNSSAMASETVGSGDYLQGWHDRHPGATSAMLDSVTDELGRNTYEMLSDVIQDGDDPILDLACGDGYLLELLHPSHACVGMDWNIAELDAAFRRRAHGAPLVRANAAGLPIATATFGAITCHYSSMLLRPLETVLAVVARSLRSGGLLATMLPAPRSETLRIQSQYFALRGKRSAGLTQSTYHHSKTIEL